MVGVREAANAQLGLPCRLTQTSLSVPPEHRPNIDSESRGGNAIVRLREWGCRTHSPRELPRSAVSRWGFERATQSATPSR